MPLTTLSSVSKSGFFLSIIFSIQTGDASPHRMRSAYTSKPKALARSARDPLLVGLYGAY